MCASAKNVIRGTVPVAQAGGGADVAVRNSLGVRIGAEWLSDLTSTVNNDLAEPLRLPRTRWRLTAAAVVWLDN